MILVRREHCFTDRTTAMVSEPLREAILAVHMSAVSQSANIEGRLADHAEITDCICIVQVFKVPDPRPAVIDS